MAGKARKSRVNKSAKPGRAAKQSSAAQARVDQYIAGQLKSMYDEAVAEPVPDQLLRLIERLDGDAASKPPTERSER